MHQTLLAINISVLLSRRPFVPMLMVPFTFPVSGKFQYSLPKLKFGVLPRECVALINFLPIRHNINSILFSINLINPASNWGINSLSVDVLGLFSLLFFQMKICRRLSARFNIPRDVHIGLTICGQ